MVDIPVHMILHTPFLSFPGVAAKFIPVSWAINIVKSENWLCMNKKIWHEFILLILFLNKSTIHKVNCSQL